MTRTDAADAAAPAAASEYATLEGAGGAAPAGSAGAGSRERIAQPAATYLVAALFLILLCVFVFTAPLVGLLATLVALLPAAGGAYVIWRLADGDLPKDFFAEQVFLGAVPGFLLALLAELALTVAFALTLFRSDARRIAALLKQPGRKGSEVAFAVARELGAAKAVLIALLTAFVLAAAVEEAVKLLIGRRARKLAPGGASDMALSARSVAASVMAGALGLAAAEHFFFTLQLFPVAARGPTFVAGAALFSLGRAAVAFPIHCGTALIMGVAMAKRFVLRKSASVGLAFLAAVVVHGSFDAVSMVATALVSARAVPMSGWVGGGVLIADVVITVGLMFYCRKAYKALDASVAYETLGVATGV